MNQWGKNQLENIDYENKNCSHVIQIRSSDFPGVLYLLVSPKGLKTGTLPYLTDPIELKKT